VADKSNEQGVNRRAGGHRPSGGVQVGPSSNGHERMGGLVGWAGHTRVGERWVGRYMRAGLAWVHSMSRLHPRAI
jgi:hypothetical protein